MLQKFWNICENNLCRSITFKESYFLLYGIIFIYVWLLKCPPSKSLLEVSDLGILLHTFS